MNSETQPHFRSGEMGFDFDDIRALIPGPPETGGSSFTALLELPSPQAVQLLVKEDFPAKHLPPPIFPSDVGLIDRASKFSVFASAGNTPESNSKSISRPLKLEAVKQEPLGSDSHPNSSSPTVSNQSLKSGKRKNRETKVKPSSKKSRKAVGKEAAEDGGDKEKLPYVHVRARRGQATDSHSLAERARREKINARMKLLQELVPGCDKISGTAMVLDEIINHVQALQRQVEFLSMRLAAVDPRIDFNLDAIMASEGGLSIDNGYTGMFATPSIWPEGQTSRTRQLQYPQAWQYQEMHQPTWGREEDPSNFINPENLFLSYNSSANSASLHTNQVKMEH